MADLRARFRSLDDMPVPDLRPEIARRLDEHARPPVGRRMGPQAVPGSRLLAGIGSLVGVALLITAGVAILYLGANPGPTAPPPSPSPWALPSGLVTERIGRGILRIVDDGAGHVFPIPAPIQSLSGVYDADAAFTPDGKVWIVGAEGLIELGRDGLHPLPERLAGRVDLTAAPDGTLWMLANDTVASFRPADPAPAWDVAPAFPGGVRPEALEVLPDGQVWALSSTTLARLDAVGWAPFPIDREFVSEGGSPRLARTTDGTFWLRVFGSDDRRHLLRFDGDTFEEATPVGAPREGQVMSVAAGPNGELWAYVKYDDEADRDDALARHDGSSWRQVRPQVSVPNIAVRGFSDGNMVVGADGRVWAGTLSDRLVAFDGSTWTEAIATGEQPRVCGQCMQMTLRVAPDGSVWVPAHGLIVGLDGSGPE
jgi:hypothetical protein